MTALIHYNMATYFSNAGCNASNWANASRPESFAPTLLDTDNWAASLQALGVPTALLTAKHGCGFALWPTTATLPDGSPYGYSVPADLNVVRRFADSMERHGIGHGLYYSWSMSYFLNVKDSISWQRWNEPPLPGQHNVSRAEYEAILLHQTEELFSQCVQL